MSIVVVCPSCQSPLRITERTAGLRIVACPCCRGHFAWSEATCAATAAAMSAGTKRMSGHSSARPGHPTNDGAGCGMAILATLGGLGLLPLSGILVGVGGSLRSFTWPIVVALSVLILSGCVAAVGLPRGERAFEATLGSAIGRRAPRLLGGGLLAVMVMIPLFTFIAILSGEGTLKEIWLVASKLAIVLVLGGVAVAACRDKSALRIVAAFGALCVPFAIVIFMLIVLALLGETRL